MTATSLGSRWPPVAPTVSPDPVTGERIRAFTPEDVPAVVALRQRVFRHSSQRKSEELAAYIHRAFLTNPWHDLDLPSLVHVDAQGEVDGFLGVIPRRMTFRERPLRVAVPTQLMVRPGAAPGTGTRLARALIAGPQDLTFSDAANDAARRLWLRVGGIVAMPTSLYFVIPLRPARYALTRLGDGLIARMLGLLARPITAVLDALRATPAPTPPHSRDTQEPLLLPRHLPVLADLLASWPLHPDYDPIGMGWQLEELARRRDDGQVQGAIVRDPWGDPVGWFLYHANRGGVGEIIQLGARRGDHARILPVLLRDAAAHGVVALAGRADPGVLEAAAAQGISFTRGGPWVLTHARDPQLLAAVLAGEAFLSRLEGEWWLNF